MSTKPAFVFWFFLCVSPSVLCLPEQRLHFKVVDEFDHPVDDAKVNISFYGKENHVVNGSTDAEGHFFAKGETSGLVRYFVEKQEYYGWSGEYSASGGAKGIIGFKRWQPDNPEINVLLKSIRNPIPMYAVNLPKVKIPVLDEFVGFDLMKKDWVIPYGRGLNKDILFKLNKRRAVSNRDYHIELVIAFPGEADGIQPFYADPVWGSEFMSPYNAPRTGYRPKEVIKLVREPGAVYNQEDLMQRQDKNYFFRVRSEPDAEGGISSAMYGKIYGPFKVDDVIAEGATGTVAFKYYLNPKPNDTNVEFDVERNFFDGLDRVQTVNRP